MVPFHARIHSQGSFMERDRKILVAILAVLVLTAVLAITDISLGMKERKGNGYRMASPGFGPGIALVRIEGPIGLDVTGPFGTSSGAEAIIRQLGEIEKDSSVKAVVVRINSPGGTVAATQEIYQKLWKLRKKNIPLVASMGEIAASGGYYVASACNVITANYGTITGSIGVIAYSPNLKRLFEKLGISMNVIKSGKYKDILATHRDITDEERKLLQSLIDSSYRKFLKDVALGRNMNQADIEPWADGRVFSGEEALEHKLVDALGTLDDALDKAREMAKLSADCPVYDSTGGPFQEFFKSLKGIANPAFAAGNWIDQYNGHRLEYRYMP